MNILFYFESQINPQRGGTERVADNISHELKKRGYEVFYLSRRKVDGEYDIPCFFLPDEKGNTERNYSFVKNLIIEHNIDIIINEGGNTEDIYFFSKEHFSNVKIITHLHFNPYLQYKYFYRSLYLPLSVLHPVKTFVNILKWIKAPWNRYNLLRHMRQRYKYMYKNSDKVILLAPTYIDEFCTIANVTNDSKKCESFYNPNTFQNILDIQEKENVVLFVGRLSFEHKRVDYLLDIWKIVSKIKNDWKLKIVGDGPDRKRLQNYCKSNDIQNVYFEGFKDISPYYAKAKVLCLTSITEGSPMVIVEAMQNGVVPIVYNTFSASEFLIDNNRNGFIIPPFDINQYVSAMTTIMKNEDLYNNMSRKCIESSDKYNLNRIVDIWEELMHQI